MVDTSNVIDRLRKYCAENPEIRDSGVIKGINPSDGKIVIEKDNQTKHITIDELESGSWLNIDSSQLTQTNNTEEVEVMEDDIETLEPAKEEIPTLDIEIPSSKTLSTLKDMKDASVIKDEVSINKALETFAIDERTGTININKAIKIVTDNSTNNVIECIKSNAVLPDDLSSYDLTGKTLTSFASSSDKVDLQKLIDQSFENILVYVEVARLKNIVYNEDQINSAKNKYATTVHDKLNVLGLNKVEEEPLSQPEEFTQSKVMDLKPDTNLKKAGFADILILTVIVLIYAAIIINLISKLR